MIHRLAALAPRGAAERRGRAALTVAGIAVAVAVTFGVSVSNATVQAAFDHLTALTPLGRSDVRLTTVDPSPTAVMPIATRDRVAAAPGVDAAIGLLELSRSVNVDIRAGSPLAATLRPLPGSVLHFPIQTQYPMTLVGVDLGGLHAIFPSFRVTTGRLPAAGPRELVLPVDFAVAVGVHAGESVAFGVERWQVVGTISGLPVNVNTAYAPLAAVEAAHGGPPALNEVDVVLHRGVDARRWVTDHLNVGGRGTLAETAASVTSGGETAFHSTSRATLGVSAIALFVGLLLVYLTMTAMVLERTRLFGILLALGASRRQLWQLVVSEALAFAAVGTTFGIALGCAMSVVITAIQARLNQISAPGLVIHPSAVAAAVVAGVGMTVTAAIVPARRASRVAPVQSLRGEVDPGRSAALGAALGAVLLVGGWLVRPSGGQHPLQASLSATALLFGAVLVVPPLVPLLAKALGRATGRLGAGTGAIAVGHLLRQRSRSALTLGLVMVVMAMTVAFAGGAAAVRSDASRQVDAQFGGDLLIRPSDRPGAPPVADLEAALTQVIPVRAIIPTWYPRSLPYVAGHPGDVARIEAIDPSSYFTAAGFVWTDGSTRRAAEALVRGGAILISSQLARSIGTALGRTVVLHTTAGDRSFTVAGLFSGFASAQTIVVSFDDARRSFGMTAPSEEVVFLRHGADPRAALVALYSDRRLRPYELSVVPVYAVKADVTRNIRRASGLYNAVLAQAAIVGLLGLANTLAMSVVERRREIGTLRALGTRRRGVGMMVVIESVTLVAVAFVLSIPLAGALTELVITTSSAGLGFQGRFAFDWGAVPIVAILGLCVALAAALLPARQAATLDPVVALRLD